MEPSEKCMFYLRKSSECGASGVSDGTAGDGSPLIGQRVVNSGLSQTGTGSKMWFGTFLNKPAAKKDSTELENNNRSSNSPKAITAGKVLEKEPSRPLSDDQK